MTVKVLVGTQWGDEGKGKITDLLAGELDIVVRYQGGNNAGHTVVMDGKTYKLHLIPSGIFYQNVVCVIGNGVVIDPEAFVAELNMLKESGIPVGPERLKISRCAHITTGRHKEVDIKAEENPSQTTIGTTRRGIGPTYEDKVGRRGIRAGDYGRELEPYLTDTVAFLNDSYRAGKRILLEGAQGTMLDVDHGTYPFVTSSNPTAGGACVGSGLGPTVIDDVIGIVKAYSTRVGEGPFPTELEDHNGKTLQDVGHEYGATTGRPRRCGWLDLVIIKHAVRVNGLTQLVITKLDVLSELPEIALCTAYELGSKRIDNYPSSLESFKDCRPVYKYFKGWQQDISGARTLAELQPEARDYLKFIEDFCAVPIKLISVGCDRKETILI